jgi:large subunit ribosomal protein L6
MSRIAKKAIKLNGVAYKVNGPSIEFTGPAGKVSMRNEPEVKINEENGVCTFKGENFELAKLGSFVMNFKNCVEGVSKQYEKKINLVGVGYKVVKKTDDLEFFVGYGEAVHIPFVEGIVYEVPAVTELILKSCNKVLIGDVAAQIVKNTRKPEPYKGKGVIIQGTFIRRKEGKKK